jgi:hypothetical protein
MAYSESSAANFQAPVYLGDMFAQDTGSDSEGEAGLGTVSKAERATLDATIEGRSIEGGLRYEVTQQTFPRMTMRIRQFDDHFRNANIAWPEARCLAEWLIGDHLDQMAEHDRKRRFDRTLIGFETSIAFPPADTTIAAAPSAPLSPPICSECGQRRKQLRVFELGAATGALAIYLAALGVDIHTSDIADRIVTENIAVNFTLNGWKQPAVHLPHSWGEKLEEVDAYVKEHGAPDVILGSDILAYEDDFAVLADTIEHLMPAAPPSTDAASSSSSVAAVSSSSTSSSCPHCHPAPVLIMCWKRSHNKALLDDGFWRVMHERDFRVETRGKKTYEIRRGARKEVKGSNYVQFIKS